MVVLVGCGGGDGGFDKSGDGDGGGYGVVDDGVVVIFCRYKVVR